MQKKQKHDCNIRILQKKKTHKYSRKLAQKKFSLLFVRLVNENYQKYPNNSPPDAFVTTKLGKSHREIPRLISHRKRAPNCIFYFRLKVNFYTPFPCTKMMMLVNKLFSSNIKKYHFRTQTRMVLHISFPLLSANFHNFLGKIFCGFSLHNLGFRIVFHPDPLLFKVKEPHQLYRKKKQIQAIFKCICAKVNFS